MITPILMGEGIGMPAGAAVPATAASVAAPDVAATSVAMVATHAGIIVVGGTIGAAIGNWLSNGN